MKITIKDVAKASGVSPSTVSRVISDSSRISDDTKHNVRDAMKKLGYHPNAIARSLVNKSTNTIGIVTPNPSDTALLNPFFSQALSGISAAAHEHAYELLLSTGSCEEEQLESITNIVMSGRVDGVIIMYSSVENLLLETVKLMNKPVTIIGKPLQHKDVLYVDNDNVDAAYRATKVLVEHGHKKIAFLGGSLEMVVTLDRLEGYRDALFECGLPFDRDYIMQSHFSRQDGYAKMTELLQLIDRPTAVVVTDDVMAIGAMEAVKENKLRIPDEIEFISFNNTPLAELYTPSLTSVDINAYKLGYEASKLIIEKIKGTSVTNRIIVSTKTIFRESTIA